MVKNKKGKKKSSIADGSEGESMILLDPTRVRFQHSRIRPYFSGCGRSVLDTLEEIRSKKLNPSDLPPIQVIIGPIDEGDGLPCYFSLNNRRLWVLKRCREEGMLENNMIQARVRPPKSTAEQNRYTISNCALEAKFMNEKREPQSKPSHLQGKANISVSQKNGNGTSSTTKAPTDTTGEVGIDVRQDAIAELGDLALGQIDSSDESDSDSECLRSRNPFSLLS